MAEKIPEQREERQATNTYYVKERRIIGNSVLLDWVITSVLVALMFFISASYFVDSSGNITIGLKKAAIDTAWVAAAILFVKELAKCLFKRKGQRTKDYLNAEARAKKAIHTLNENVDSDKVQEYCDEVTEQTIKRHRKYQLTTVGMELDSFNSKYLGKGTFTLVCEVIRHRLSLLQARAVWRCNHVKTKPYDPNFITSYSAEDNSALVPSQQNNAKKADRQHSFKSLFLTMGSSFGVCFAFRDIFLNFSKEMVFLAIIKIILLIVNFALNAIFGWNLSLIEQARNESRTSEAKKCMKYADVDQAIIKKVDEEEKEEVEEKKE